MTVRRVLVSLCVVALVGVGFGAGYVLGHIAGGSDALTDAKPVSENEARRLLVTIVKIAQAGDDVALCETYSTVVEWCKESLPNARQEKVPRPTEAPRVVSSKLVNGCCYYAARYLSIELPTADGKTFTREFRVYRQEGELRAFMPVYWCLGTPFGCRTNDK
ncbi:hypothetical protein [Actinopolymorpha alba]|uniref:hypothetical protein n=1 Tax=Actinopolymorpha alba TaxID=533267 RepID=UPI000373EA82|nr:hypothetical protein [Actinopolymorpha alba]